MKPFPAERTYNSVIEASQQLLRQSGNRAAFLFFFDNPDL
jgi:hypothetical protein